MNLNEFLKTLSTKTKHYPEEYLLGAKMALEPLIQFNLSKVPEILGDDLDLDEPGTFTFDQFLKLTDTLQNTHLTENQKKTLLYNAAQNVNVREWNYFYRKILLKQKLLNLDTYLKITAKLKNPSLIFNGFPNPKVNLCKRKLKTLYYLEPYHNNVYVILNRDNNTVTMYDHNYDVIKHNVLHNVLKNLLVQMPDSIVFQGFLVENDLTLLMITDIIPYWDFVDGGSEIPLMERQTLLEALAGMFQEFCCVADSDGEEIPIVRVEPKLLIDFNDPRNNLKYELYVANMQQLGHTELLAKRADSFYMSNPEHAWLRIKI